MRTAKMSDLRALRLDEDEMRALIPQAAQNANKYSRGTVGVVGGSEAYPGAPVLAALAAGRSGAGYTRMITVQGAMQCARSHLLSIPVTGCMQSVDGTFCRDSAQGAVRALEKSSVVLVGPGMGTTDDATRFLHDLIAAPELVSRPFVFDADALNILAEHPEMMEARAASVNLLTPHDGEAARLLGRRLTSRNEDIITIANMFMSTVLLKGPQTLVSDGASRPYLMEEGGPELAKAGTGDVLGGIIAAFLSQGLDAVRAAYLGAYVHARAGKIAACKLGVHAVMPEDIIDKIGPALLSVEAKGSQ